MKDIFPSLHTAGPCFIAMFSFRNRDRLARSATPGRCSTFFAANIIGATMFLRWHYVIDVLAGFALATLAAAGRARVTRWEVARRARVEPRPAGARYSRSTRKPRQRTARPTNVPDALRLR